VSDALFWQTSGPVPSTLSLWLNGRALNRSTRQRKLSWQFAFFVIATEPGRFRPIIFVSVLEKFSYVFAVVVLYLQGRVSLVQSVSGVPDFLLGLLFIVAFINTHIRS